MVTAQQAARNWQVKILDINKEEIQHKILALGAECVGKFHIHDKQFDFPDKKIKAADELLRLRVIDGRGELTYKDEKRSEDGFRVAKESETSVTDHRVIEYVLQKLGLEVYCDREKTRTSFKKGDLKFEIDEYPNIPPYLEIEGEKETILQALNLLGYTMENTTDMTATEVLRHYGTDPYFIKNLT